MDPVLIAMLTKLGVDTVVNLIAAWRRSGEPTDDELRALEITKKPEDYFDKDTP